MTDLPTILAQLESAEGPSRELDRDLWEMFDPKDFQRFYYNVKGSSNKAWPAKYKDEWTRERLLKSAPAYTASIDAALGLVERVLGDEWNVTIATAYGSVNVIPNDPDSLGVSDPRAGHAYAPTIPLAILSALIKAKIAEEESVDG